MYISDDKVNDTKFKTEYESDYGQYLYFVTLLKIPTLVYMHVGLSLLFNQRYSLQYVYQSSTF